jgi:pimeloyl-ACP methyl ester carboxylesterase
MNRPNLILAVLALSLGTGSAPAAPVMAAPAVAPARAFAPTRFSVQIVGSGPDVILIPGLAGSREVWRGSANGVPGYRYHLVQVAGFAGAPARGNARGPVVAPLAEEIARYIAANRLDRPAIVGHSMGGTVAMMVAARYPSRVGKVMVVDMLPQPAGLLGGSANEMRGLADALRDLSSTAEGRGLVEGAIRMFGGPQAANRSDPDIVARATHELAVTDMTRELTRIAAPMTVVYAVIDPSRQVSTDRVYRSAYAPRRGTRLVRIDDSGHMIMADQPARFRAELRGFLRN